MDSWNAITDRNDIDTLANILEYSSIRDYEESEAKRQELKALMSIIAGKQL